MTSTQLGELRRLQGRTVGLALAGGERIDGAQLVSVGRGPARKVWVFAGGADRFVPAVDVADVWEADRVPVPGRRARRT